MIIDETGGSHGVRDNAALLLLETLPKQAGFGREFYPTAYEKAAAYARTIIMNHPFIDGNKRSGMTVAAVFLEDNGFRFAPPQGAIEGFAVSVVTKRLDIKKIAAWFETHCKT